MLHLYLASRCVSSVMIQHMWALTKATTPTTSRWTGTRDTLTLVHWETWTLCHFGTGTHGNVDTLMLEHWETWMLWRWDTGKLGCFDAGTLGNLDAEKLGHWDTWTLGHWDAGTLGHWDTNCKPTGRVLWRPGPWELHENWVHGGLLWKDHLYTSR